ncbi:transposase [Mesorhizobium japonicum MAFF 303099]|uniref:Transposase n=1 Tax=Mesorhizobium japonicum (strain LMG 29417 / CECT 9101 / MAFF 303099) TaxID=266835 RepID=Q98AH7_RHILO|nr:transposase [Mesorhizobium japonicum MAFF 303099]
MVGGLSHHFDNRRQVAAYAGLAPTPWQSGSVDHDQGGSKAGNPRLRTTLIQVAWLWLRHQPHSALSLWFKQRVKQNDGRLKKHSPASCLSRCGNTSMPASSSRGP